MDLLRTDVRWTVAASSELTGRAVARGLAVAGFVIDSHRGFRLEAHAGSSWMPRFGSRRGPMRADATIVAACDSVADGSEVTLTVAEAEVWARDVAPSTDAYRAAFGEVLGAVQTELLRLDPDLPARSEQAAPDLRMLDRRTQIVGIGRRLAPAFVQHRHTGSVTFVHEGREAVIGSETAERMLLVVMAAGADPAIPSSLAGRFAELGEVLLPVVRDAAMVVVPVDLRSSQLVEFGYRQASIRRALPEREIWRCHECGTERLVNPEVARTSQRRRTRSTLTMISSSAAGVLLGSTSSMVSLAARVATLGSGETDGFRCGRCQGCSREILPATICPRCRRIQAQPVLRACLAEGCGFEFGSVTADVLEWSSAEPASVDPPAAPATMAADWYADPSARWAARWWDGGGWTPWVCAPDGTPGVDALVD